MMPKWIFTSIPALFLLALPLYCFAEAAEPTTTTTQEEAPRADNAIEVEIHGGFAGFDTETYATVRSMFGGFVADGTIEHFITTVRGLDGGGTFCIELAPLALPRRDVIVAQFQEIHPDPVTTFYGVRTVEACNKPVY